MTSTVPLERYCPACGAANEYTQGEDARCFACGSPLEGDAPTPAANGAGGAEPPPLLHGRYRVINQVGTGGYGAVYRAQDTQDGDKVVAIKAIHLRGLKPQEAIEATDTFNREVSLLTGLAHANLPRVYDHFTDNAHWFLVMDFIAGETLEDYIRHTSKTGQLPLSEVLEIGIQLCTVLEYLHTRQPPIIFRDVKPANIMRAKRGHLYLIDFGIARRHKPGQRKDTIALGSPGYAAPEQYGRAQTTAQADIYSLGVTLHQLLTGHDPAETPFHLPPLDSFQLSLPSKMIALIERMIDLDASKRSEGIIEVRQTLQDIAAEQLRALAPLPDATSGQVYYIPLNAPATGKVRQIAKTKRGVSGILRAGLVLVVGMAIIAGAISYLPSVHPGPPIINSAPPPSEVLRIGVVNDGSAGRDKPQPLQLDPALANDAQSAMFSGMLFTGLTSLSGGTVYPQLAQSWVTSPDGLTWTFHLRPDLRFSSGSPLTSEDVAYSLNRALSPATHSPTALATLGMIKDAQRLHAGKIYTLISDSIFTPDPYTITITLASPGAYFLAALAAPVATVVAQTPLTRLGEQRYFTGLSYTGSSGPFEMAQQDTTGIQLVPNPYYYGVHPQLQKIVLLFYENADQSFDAYQNAGVSSANAVDITPIPLDRVTTARTESGQFRQILQPILYYYGMNYLEKPFNNIHIRRAFALALDKNLITQAFWHGTRAPIDSLLPASVSGYDSILEGPDGQYTTAGEVQWAKMELQAGLQEEGWSSVSQLPPITFTYAASSLQQTEEIEAAVEMWHDALGVTVKLRPVSTTDLNRGINATVNNSRGLQMWASSWQAAYNDPQQWASLSFSAGSPFNAVNYGQNHSSDFAQQQRTQQMLATADAMLPGSDRIGQYSSAEQQLINDVAWIPVSQGVLLYLVQPYVEGSSFSTQYQWASPSFWNSVFIRQH